MVFGRNCSFKILPHSVVYLPYDVSGRNGIVKDRIDLIEVSVYFRVEVAKIFDLRTQWLKRSKGCK